MSNQLSPGDKWAGCYRGYRLQTNPNREVWWQAYQGTDRLYLEPTPDSLIDDVAAIKRLGGRIHVTEDGSVITRVEENDSYEATYVGEINLRGKLVPEDGEQYAIDVRPSGLSSGDLWPSVYDGAKFSFGGDRIWWQNPQTHKRHPVKDSLPSDVLGTLQRLKPNGGSFRVTPWNDVITLVETPPNTTEIQEQLQSLPRVIKNIILLRRERGVEMLPIFVGSLDETPLTISEPKSLTDALSPTERAQLDSWAGSLGPTSDLDAEDHRIQSESAGQPADDPEDW